MTTAKINKKASQLKEAIEYLNSLQIATSNSSHADANPKSILRDNANSTLINHVLHAAKNGAHVQRKQKTKSTTRRCRRR